MIISRGAGWRRVSTFVLAGVVIIVANIFDFLRHGRHQLHLGPLRALGFHLDRFSDLALLTGLIFLYSKLGRSDYVLIAALTLIFSIMTSYARARAESLVPKCKVGFMERPERIVLFMIGAFTNRMAGVLWVILVLSILAVANRIYYTYLALNDLPLPSKTGLRGAFNRAFFWTRAQRFLTTSGDRHLAFVWLTRPTTGDPTARHGCWVIKCGWIRLRPLRPRNEHERNVSVLLGRGFVASLMLARLRFARFRRRLTLFF